MLQLRKIKEKLEKIHKIYFLNFLFSFSKSFNLLKKRSTSNKMETNTKATSKIKVFVFIVLLVLKTYKKLTLMKDVFCHADQPVPVQNKMDNH